VTYLVSNYQPGLVAVSLLVATFASYVGLDLAKRVRDQNKGVAFGWWAGGSVALGTGIWCMHFVGMLAFTLPIELGYSRAMTALSWCAAVAASGIALFIAVDATMDWRRLCASSAVMGAGISAMHYTGMAAMEMAPGIEWHGGLVALSVVIAVGASMALGPITTGTDAQSGLLPFVVILCESLASDAELRAFLLQRHRQGSSWIAGTPLHGVMDRYAQLHPDGGEKPRS
jgi:NO-binding membrane sensor protein with MHYT domain